MINSAWPLEKSKHADDWEIANLPIHIHEHPVGSHSIISRSKWMREVFDDGDDSILGALCTRFDHQIALFAAIGSAKHWNEVMEEAALHPNDLDELHRAHLIRLAPPHLQCTIRVFTCAEKEIRRRWITHTPILNEVVEDMLGQFTLPEAHDMMAQVAYYQYGLCVDLW